MKPLVLAELAGSAGYGGGERYLELLFDRLARTQFAPILICPEPGPFVTKMREKDIPTTVVQLEPLLNPIALVRLARLLRRHKVTILQTHGARSNVYGGLAAWLAAVPCVVFTVHNSVQDYDVSPIRRWVYEVVLRVMLSLADRIICVSHSTKHDLLMHAPDAATRTIVITNGIDPAVFTQSGHRDTVRELKVGPGPVLLTVARLTEQKGHRFLIDALPGLLADWPSLVCVCVGEGECRESLRAVACAKGVEHACHFVGAQDDVVDWYAAADVVVLPSLSEGFPFVILEALAMARPVVATAVNGVPEIIQDGRTGLLVPPRDAPALEAAIRRVLRDPFWGARLGAAGKKDVGTRFTATQMVHDTVAVFYDMLAAAQQAPAISQKEAA